MAKRIKRNAVKKLNPLLLNANAERAQEISDSLYQVLMTEGAYSTFTNQQFAMAIDMLLNRFRAQRSPEAWIYICAIIRGGLENPTGELVQPFVNTLRNKCEQDQAEDETTSSKVKKP